MGLGVVLGLSVGPNSALLPHDGVRLSPSAVIRTAPAQSAAPARYSQRVSVAERLGEDPTGRFLHIRWRVNTRTLLGEGAGPGAVARGDSVTGWVRSEPGTVAPFSRLGQTLVNSTEWLGRLFLALIKMVVVPLVFLSLTVGVASLGDVRKLGRLGGRTVGLFSATTVVALLLGVGLANVLRPGSVLTESDRAGLLVSYKEAASKTVESAAQAPSLVDQLIGIVPANPLASLARGEMLQIIFFAVMFGIALTLLDRARSESVVRLLDNANEAMVMLVHIAMKLAPLGVAALLFKVVGTTGVSVLLALGVYGLVVVAGLLLHLTLTYGGLVTLVARLPFWGFLKALRPALLLAFSTSSSSATLPVTKECLENNLKVSNSITSFVVPLGATINMDGTALYQGVAALFIAQIYGMDLSVADQATIVVSATLASVGAAGVPGAGMITLAMVLTSVGVPTEGLALVLGVDRLLDMFRTAVNVVGDSAAAVSMARLEGERPEVLSLALARPAAATET